MKPIELPKGYTFFDLVDRAVRNAKPDTTGKTERWVAVRDTFGVGKTTAKKLCRSYQLDPSKEVFGTYCPYCDLED